MINKVFERLILLTGTIIYIILPSVNMDTLMNDTQSGKTVFFLGLILIMVLISAVKLLIPRKRFGIKYSTLDILLLIFSFIYHRKRPVTNCALIFAYY